MSVISITEMWSKKGGQVTSEQFSPQDVSYQFTRGFQAVVTAGTQEPAVLGPRIGLADQQEQIAVLFDPHVHADIAIADGHGARGILARRVPDDDAAVQRIAGFALFRMGSGIHHHDCT